MAHIEEEPKNKLILGIGVGSIGVIVATMFTLGSYYDVLRDREQHDKIGARENPDLVELRALEDKRLGENAYAVIDPNDPKKRHVRIPIDRAIALMAQRGRDAIPSIQPDPANQAIVVPGAPAAASSAAPAGSAPPAGSAAPPASSAAPPAPAPKH